MPFKDSFLRLIGRGPAPGLPEAPVTKAKGSGRTPDVLSPVQGQFGALSQGPFILPYPSDILMIETVVKYSPVAAAIVQNIRNECWRADLELIPKFGARCTVCNREFEDDLESLRMRPSMGRQFVAPGEEEEEGEGFKLQCGVCGHKWNSRVPQPLRCPNCGSYEWGGGMGRKPATRGYRRSLEEEKPPIYEAANNEPVLCPDCGGLLQEPDMAQVQRWNDFASMRNTHGLTFRTIGEMCTDDITKFDDAYIIFRWEYIIGPDGEIAGKTLKELLRGPAARMRIIKDERDRRGEYMVHGEGQGFWTCPIHRARNVKNRPGRCEREGCNAVLQPAEYVALDFLGQEDILYLEGEVLHWSEYAPGESYGFSPILTCWSELKCLVNISRLAGSIYEQFRPPKGYLVFRTRNFESLQTQILEAEEKLKTNPVYIPKLAVESEAGERFVEWLPLTNDFNELQTIPLMKELRERIEAVFGVSNLMMADTSASGGLNNEGMQITVTLRTIDRRQHIWEAVVLPILLKNLEITDFELRFPPPIEEDRMAQLERRRLNLELMARAMEMGSTVEVINDEDFEFKLTSPIAFAPGMGPMNAPGDPRNPNAGGEDNGGAPGGEGPGIGQPGQIPQPGEHREKALPPPNVVCNVSAPGHKGNCPGYADPQRPCDDCPINPDTDDDGREIKRKGGMEKSFLSSAGWTPAPRRIRTPSEKTSMRQWMKLSKSLHPRYASTLRERSKRRRTSLDKSGRSGTSGASRRTRGSSKRA
jgi:hypothetical protein